MRPGAFLTQQVEQQMLGSDVLVEQPIGFLGGVHERTRRFGAERYLDRCRHRLAATSPGLGLSMDLVEREVGTGNDPARHRLTVANNPEEQVLGLDGDAAKLARFIASEEKRASRLFRIALEHGWVDLVDWFPSPATGAMLRCFSRAFKWRTWYDWT